jgi:hypothetical protein
LFVYIKEQEASVSKLLALVDQFMTREEYEGDRTLAPTATILQGALWKTLGETRLSKGTELWNRDILRHDLIVPAGAVLMARRLTDNEETALKSRIPYVNGIFDAGGGVIHTLQTEIASYGLVHAQVKLGQFIQWQLAHFSKLNELQKRILAEDQRALRASLQRRRASHNVRAFKRMPQHEVWLTRGMLVNVPAGRALLQGVINDLGEHRAEEIRAIMASYLMRDLAIKREIDEQASLSMAMRDTLAGWLTSAAHEVTREDLVRLRHKLEEFAEQLHRKVASPLRPYLVNLQLCYKDVSIAISATEDLLGYQPETNFRVKDAYRRLELALRRVQVSSRAALLMRQNEILVMFVRVWLGQGREATVRQWDELRARITRLAELLADVEDNCLRRPYATTCADLYRGILSRYTQRPSKLNFETTALRLKSDLKVVTALLGFPEIDVAEVTGD